MNQDAARTGCSGCGEVDYVYNLRTAGYLLGIEWFGFYCVKCKNVVDSFEDDLRNPTPRISPIFEEEPPKPARQRRKANRYRARRQKRSPEAVEADFTDHLAEQFESRKRAAKLQRIGGGIECDSCRDDFHLHQVRVLFRRTEEGELVPKGTYCTDCFYTRIDFHGRSGSSQMERHYPRFYRLPNLSKQESMSHEALMIRSHTHVDLRWEFGFLGKKTNQYGQSAIKRKKQNAVIKLCS